jgi:membrane associated rhomboid family serine protease
MFKRQRTGSVVCSSCGNLVGVNDERCFHCGRRNPGLWGFAPLIRQLGNDMGFVPFVTGTCVVVFALTLLSSAGNIGMNGIMNFLAPSTYSLVLYGASGALPVFGLHRWWTVLSASWLHGGLLHILFNMLWVRQLAPEVGELYGPGRMVIIYTVAGVVGFTATSVAGAYLTFLPGILRGAPITLGASASIFGLLGATVYYGRRTGSHVVHQQAVYYAVILFIFGLVMPGVDNWAHAGGFVGGFLTGRLLDPLRPERIDHLVGALACLLLSILSIIVSVIHGLMLS